MSATPSRQVSATRCPDPRPPLLEIARALGRLAARKDATEATVVPVSDPQLHLLSNSNLNRKEGHDGRQDP